jgi:hypothetical protein
MGLDAAPDCASIGRLLSIKDPTIVRYNNLYHVFATIFDTSRNAWSAVYLNFSDFSKAGSAAQVSLANKAVGDHRCAAGLFLPAARSGLGRNAAGQSHGWRAGTRPKAASWPPREQSFGRIAESPVQP